MATDIAFALGVLALLGPRVPDQLRLFLLTAGHRRRHRRDPGHRDLLLRATCRWPALLAVALLVAALAAVRWLQIWRTPAYVALGLALWLAVLQSGVHPTIAGVLMGLLVSTRAPAGAGEATPYARALGENRTAERARLVRLAASSTVSPNERMQHALHPWTSYVIVPLFALANAGVRLDAETLRAAARSPITIGVVVALVVGKIVGITGSTLLALRLRLGVLPGRIMRGQLLGGATLAGIGFTVALFITDLAFDDPALREQAVVGVLTGSLLAAALGWSVFHVLGERGGVCATGRGDRPGADASPATLVRASPLTPAQPPARTTAAVSDRTSTGPA